ncbi:invasion associated locus B family protein [Kaistia geumhonensis]|uniref:Invasion protein IalB n=1 Tax=Kaistia geumhonensis TaxID=410839 RepID=A0ABU0M3G0_9HYPH|nr:invasion associated locus B family protein [Kaistia geumhonensis]MCX5479290.1 invasion associated locus B family protein [Kaistia geumhonensis]MDQ0515489.1 invasion protein IalB [Kaistia geumhonensis]
MSDSFDELEPPDPRSTLHRVVEGLTVVALVVAVILWQSDGTLMAARTLLGMDGDAQAEPSATLVAMSVQPQPIQPQSSDIRLVKHVAPAVSTPDIDPVATGSVAAATATRPARPITPPDVRPFPAQPAPDPVRLVTPSVALPPPPLTPRGWTAACDRPEASFCTASQSLSQPDDPLVETSWTIEHSAGGLFAIWTAPTGVMVDRGMTLIMGDGRPKTVPFTACGAHSCEVRARLAGDFVSLLRRSSRISTEIVLKNGKTVSFDFSREGLDAALAKLGV